MLVREHEVYFCTPRGDFTEKIEALGCKFVPCEVLERRGTNPIKDLQLVSFYNKTIGRIKPDVVLTYTIKPNVYGGIVSAFRRVPYFSNITGLGTTIENGGPLAYLTTFLYKLGLMRSSCVFFQNAENRKLFVSRKIAKGKTRLIPGSGVNLKTNCLEEYPADKNRIRFLFVGRIMRDKGIGELLWAIRKLHKEREDVILDVVGFCDEDYTEELKKAEEEGAIIFHGVQSDVHPFYKSCHCTVLPSYHEGMANVMLESSATGRPVITTRVPGCRETFDEEKTGFGCEAKDAEGLYMAMKRFLDLSQEQREEMGRNARKKMEAEYDRNIILKAYNEEISIVSENINRKKCSKCIKNKKEEYKEMQKMGLYEKLVNREEKLSLVGLGYVGMPIAVAFAKKVDVIGFDLNEKKIGLYKSGIDPTHEVGDEEISKTTVEFTADETKLREAKFHIVAVPTPVNDDHTPDLTPVEGASKILGRNLTKGSVVVFESTVYPGVTEDVCVPILEAELGLKCGVDFKIGYSPERINPGDKVHRLETITKIVSGMDEETLDCVAKVYELVVEAGVHRAQSIKVAEAAKVIENSQRDINIAFMNELSIIFNKMGIDTKSVLEAAGTKWNFLNFYPGLVGGHCIGVDPYYLTYKAEMFGYHSQIILAGRRINDDMGKYIAENCVKNIIASDKAVKGAKVAILGFTFKENCPDTRNTKIIDIVNELREYGISPVVADPRADAEEAKKLYGIEFVDIDTIKDMDAVILAVAHSDFSCLTIERMNAFYNEGKKVLLDIKGLLDRKEYENAGYHYWRL
ncbi:MAG: nucleotide sugar dehydrogenase, partial [Oscillospiraceae bacterium]|nr:nucleotide sugar dehydrogenase [Oscillospiraceae bacterium]